MAGRGRPAAPRRSVRSQKKNQTTLQFSPLPSSSPAKANYSHAIQDRLASVRYRGSRGLSIGSSGNADEDVATLPTPEPSSQHETMRHAREPHNTPDSIPSSPLVRSVAVPQDEESEDDDVVVSAKKRRKILADTPATDLHSSPPLRRSSRFNITSSSPIRDVGVVSSLRNRRSGGFSHRSSSPPSRSLRFDSSHSGDLSTPVRRLSTKLSDLGSAETTDDDDLVMISKPTQRRRRKPQPEAKDPFVVNDDEVQYESASPGPTRTGRKTQRRKADDFIADDNSIEYISSDSDANEPKHKPIVSRSSVKHSSRRTREEQEELEEDLHDLQDSDDGEIVVTSRTRGGPVSTERDKTREHFELLRRRRAGEKVPRIVDSDDDNDEEEVSEEMVDLRLIGQPAAYNTEQGSAHSSVDTDQESIVEQVEDEDDFIEDDSTGRLGRPHPDIPLQFTSFASAKPRELFPHIIEWLVKNKIAPAFSRDDELYTLAFSRVDDQVKAQAGSRLISAAWGTDFKNTILARPMMKVVALPGLDEDNIRTCDACNRVNHPARYEFKFSGEPYYQKTLEPVELSDDEDGQDRDDGVTYDEQGHLLPSEQRRFYLGRFCAANAEMGHKLTHWKYHLNESLMAYLEEQGVLSADAIVARDKMNKKKREKQAEGIVDSMQETGVIADLWADFENDLNDARLGMEDFDKKGGRSKGRVGAIRARAHGTIREWSGDKYRVMRALESDSEGD
ncbi:hypothetical protein PV08_01531 [Exophiala spinifera]|uniref:DUF4211 domain-containing protein n=1 Tax=Exophiala spinifera TaxID=91928 RepID=A0A0D2A854_9EURO|nr:uncharacterized protein PV08_01531 [Exophiala spinifera]KIW20952.1 hypothetical protein PV08_01531 [Exophiala spinifera]